MEQKSILETTIEKNIEVNKVLYPKADFKICFKSSSDWIRSMCIEYNDIQPGQMSTNAKEDLADKAALSLVSLFDGLGRLGVSHYDVTRAMYMRLQAKNNLEQIK